MPDAWHPLDLPTREPVEGSPRLVALPKLRSRELQNYRDVVVALPPSYDNGTRRYPLVLMHDGQNLFDPETSYAGAWGLLGVLRDLAAQGTEAVVAGIANAGPFRKYEYSPFRDARHGGGDGDRYLDFVVDTVLPRVEAEFRVETSPGSRAIAGSSMGGLLSLYALWQRADVFGAAAALSPSTWFAEEAIIGLVRRRPLPEGRLWLDTGTGEGELMLAATRRLRDALVASGLTPGPRFEYVEDEGATHHEEHWGRRFRKALPFLLGRTEPPADRPTEGA